MAITPTSPMSMAMVALQTTIAHSPAWHEWAGLTNRPEGDRPAMARTRTHLYGLPAPSEPGSYLAEELEALRPACVITYLPPAWLARSGFGYRMDRMALEHFVERGVLYVHVVDDVGPGRETWDDSDLLIAFTNNLGALIHSMLTRSEVEGAAYIRSIDVCVEPSISNEIQRDTQGMFVNSMLKVDWGMGR